MREMIEDIWAAMPWPVKAIAIMALAWWLLPVLHEFEIRSCMKHKHQTYDWCDTMIDLQ